MAQRVFGKGFQTKYPQTMEIAYPGKAVEIISAKTHLNLSGRTQQVVTLEIGDVSGDANDVFEFTLPGVGSVSYTADASPTATEIINGLMLEFNKNIDINRVFTAEKSTSPTAIILKSRILADNVTGMTFTGGANTALSNVAAGTMLDIPYGIVLVQGPTYPVFDGVGTVTAPVAANHPEVGFGIAAHGRERAAETVAALGRFRPEDPIASLDKGVIWALTEEALSPGDTPVYRHTTTAATQVPGAISKTTATQKRAFGQLKVAVLEPSIDLGGGILITKVDVAR